MQVADGRAVVVVDRPVAGQQPDRRAVEPQVHRLEVVVAGVAGAGPLRGGRRTGPCRRSSWTSYADSPSICSGVRPRSSAMRGLKSMVRPSPSSSHKPSVLASTSFRYSSDSSIKTGPSGGEPPSSPSDPLFTPVSGQSMGTFRRSAASQSHEAAAPPPGHALRCRGARRVHAGARRGVQLRRRPAPPSTSSGPTSSSPARSPRSSRPSPGGDDVISSGDPVFYTFDVDETFKGDRGDGVVESVRDGATCGLEGMQVDQSYVVFAGEREGRRARREPVRRHVASRPARLIADVEAALSAGDRAAHADGDRGPVRPGSPCPRRCRRAWSAPSPRTAPRPGPGSAGASCWPLARRQRPR